MLKTEGANQIFTRNVYMYRATKSLGVLGR